MKKYYELLDVTPFSTVSEIKHSFRQKAKMLHPDLNADDDDFNRNEKMRELLSAYRYIMEKHKSFIERNIFQNKQAREFNYRQWLLERYDYESRAKLIVFDLFHEREKSGIAEYLRLLDLDVPFIFSKYFSREDFMDYGFVLAEELFLKSIIMKRLFCCKKFAPWKKKSLTSHIFFPKLSASQKIVSTELKQQKTMRKF